MKTGLTMMLCVGVLVLSGGCDATTLSTLADLAGVDLNGLDVNSLITQAQSIVAQAGSGSQIQDLNLVSKTAEADAQIPWFNPWR